MRAFPGYSAAIRALADNAAGMLRYTYPVK
jgi:hypothetical protein